MSRSPSRRGFALPTALGALVIIGLLVAGLLYTSSTVQRTAVDQRLQNKAARAAELGIAQTMLNWDGSVMNPMLIGAVKTLTIDSTTQRGWKAVTTTTKLNPTTYLIASQGYAGRSGDYQGYAAINQTVKVRQPNFNFLGALTVSGAIQVGGSSQINGNNSTPSGWSECPPIPSGSSLPGLVVDNLSDLNPGPKQGTCNPTNCMGYPTGYTSSSTASASSTYSQFGDISWNDLTSMATIKLSSVTTSNTIAYTLSNGKCDYTNAFNWGDPSRTNTDTQCDNYYPIIYVNGPVKVSGGSGQGILLINGDLTISGGFDFYGPVVVMGQLVVTGTGAHLNGGVLVKNSVTFQNNNNDLTTVLGNTVVNYSTCAVQMAVAKATNAQPALQRGWAEGF